MSPVSENMENPYLSDAFINAVDSLGRLQENDGCIAPAHVARAEAVLRLIVPEAKRIADECGQAAYGEALERDFASWQREGLAAPPDFSASRDALRAPEDGRPFFFLGPLRLANGGVRGWRMESFAALREEPDTPEYSKLYARFPHPKNICQSSHLLSGSRGLCEGNNIVFFPENIQANKPLKCQDYAVFFFNKFHKIFNEITIPTAMRNLMHAPIANVTASDPRRCYLARCVWGYLHDYFHHQGVRPFDEHITAKTRWFTGLLEEIKVDLLVWLACRENDFIDADTVAEFIVLDRAFRYPTEPDWARNFDSGTGLLLLAMLHEKGAVRICGDGSLVLDIAAFEHAARAFICDVEAIEALPDSDYISAARAIVRRFLPDADGKDRFALPDCLKGTRLATCVGGAQSLLQFDAAYLRKSLAVI